MARIAINSAFESVEVDLWGEVYALRAVTRSVEKKAVELEKKLTDETDSDTIVTVIGQLLDARLLAEAGQPKPSSAVVKKWKADELSLAQLFAFLNNLAEHDRPT